MCGGVASLLLSLMGFCVLHASAVEHKGRGFGLVGHSGWGKSTTAARLCIAGARLITDDVLAIAPTTALISGRCRELRLRGQAETLAKLVPVVEDPRLTADERIAIRPVLAPHEETPLHSLIEIGLYKDIDGLRVEASPLPRRSSALWGPFEREAEYLPVLWNRSLSRWWTSPIRCPFIGHASHGIPTQ